MRSSEDRGGPGSQVTTIVGDESGAEGENLMRARDSVFVYATVNLSTDEASALIEDLRRTVPSNAVEMKSKHALARKRRPQLLETIARIGSRGDIYMLDKSYYTTALMLDLLVGAHAAEYDFDLGQSGEGARLAVDLHNFGPAVVGTPRWEHLLRAFNDVIDLLQRIDPLSTENYIFTVFAKKRDQVR